MQLSVLKIHLENTLNIKDAERIKIPDMKTFLFQLSTLSLPA
jgi:hypothetical protein